MIDRDAIYKAYLRLFDFTYEEVSKHFEIRSIDKIASTILNTVEGHSSKPDRKPYLGDIDSKVFLNAIRDHAHDLNCLSLAKASLLAAHLHTARYKSAKILLLVMKENFLACKTFKRTRLFLK